MVQFLLKYFCLLSKRKMSKNKRKSVSEYSEKPKKVKDVLCVISEISTKIKEDIQPLNDMANTSIPGEFNDITISDLNMIATLGKGGFARVDLVHHVHNPSLTFAMKRVKKEYVKESKQEQHLINERELMMSCNNQFICRMYTTFRDDKYIYMLLEACLGGEVWTILRNNNLFDEYTAKFIIACVTEAFQYLHPRGIIYRDLKPENLLLDSRGYIKLVDFGFAKDVRLQQKTWSFCGTPAYLAPEMIRKNGHDQAVDYWALGILTHELLTGEVPFTDGNLMKLFFMILKGFDSFQFKNVSSSARKFIKHLCKLDPLCRLGRQKNGIADIRNHTWFRGFDWKSLVAGTLPAPIKNPVKNSHDTSNFDLFKDEEETVEDEFSKWDADCEIEQ